MANDNRPVSPSDPSAGGLGRRQFLGTVAAAAATMGLSRGADAATADPVDAKPGKPEKPEKAFEKRAKQARKLRHEMADLAYHRPDVDHPSNGEERDYPYVGNFSKGLPHNGLGEVDPAAYATLLAALASGDPADFELIPLGGTRRLRNPKAGLAFDLEGPDSHHLASPPAPRLDSAWGSGEMGELYWLALARDVVFNDYETSPLVSDACADLNAFSDLRAPKELGSVTPKTIFRGSTPGDLTGPYLSQFMLRDVPWGSLTLNQRQATAVSGSDFGTSYAAWIDLQRGLAPTAPFSLDPTPRYLRSGRDLAAYVRDDALYQAYLNACLILLVAGAPFDTGNPYLAAQSTDGFGTFGPPHVLSLVTEVATRALKAVWYQKWFVHRRLRPEAYGGRVHNHLSGAASYPLNAEILNADGAARTFSQNGTYLLPLAYPEGSPLHPAYGSGHATVAGACVTILKAWFDESWALPNPVVPDASGTALLPYTGPDTLTVGGELDKLAANIAMGRNFAGIHWRSDYAESLRLGEEVAIGILEEQHETYRETNSFTLTRFDGVTITI